MVLAGQPELPKYFAEMKRITATVRAARRVPPLPHIAAQELGALLDGGAVVDTRPAKAFAARHVPGTINIPLNKSFTTWAGSLIPFDRDFYLIVTAGDGHIIDEASRDLAMIGLDCVVGYLGTDAIDAWHDELESTKEVTVTELASRVEAGDVQVIDVRSATEYDAGHVPGVKHIPLGSLPDHLKEISPDKPIVVHCQGGGRSAIAAGLIPRPGRTAAPRRTRAISVCVPASASPAAIN